jgi:hypothetical protein
MRHFTALILIPALVTVLHGTLYPQDSLWTRDYGGSAHDGAQSVDLTSDGGYVVTGFTGGFGIGGNVHLFKTDALGNQLWSRSFGGVQDEVGSCVRETADGGFIVSGRQETSPENFDAYLIRTDAAGNFQWSRAYDLGDDERAHAVAQTSDGGFILAGQAWLGDDIFGSYDVYVIKTDAQGNVEWEQTYEEAVPDMDHDIALSVQETSDGNYIIGGFTQSFGWDALLMKIDPLGNRLWSQRYDRGGADECYDVRETTDGGYILTGTSVGGGGDGDVLLLKTDSAGNPVWTRVFGGASDDLGQSVRETRSGGYIITGMTASFGVDIWDVYVIKTNALGNAVWTRTYGGISDDRGFAVEQTWDGGYIIGGWEWSFAPGELDAWLLRIEDAAEPPLVSIDLVPDNPPVIVPRGGSFGYTGTLSNNTDQSQTVDVWIMAELFGDIPFGPIRQFENVPIGPNGVLGAHLTERVPNRAPLGVHELIAYTGIFPSVVIDSSYFEVEITE